MKDVVAAPRSSPPTGGGDDARSAPRDVVAPEDEGVTRSAACHAIRKIAANRATWRRRRRSL